MTVEAARQCAKERKEWRALESMYMIEFHEIIFPWYLYSFGPPSRALVAYNPEKDGIPLRDSVGVNCTKFSTSDI